MSVYKVTANNDIKDGQIVIPKGTTFYTYEDGSTGFYPSEEAMRRALYCEGYYVKNENGARTTTANWANQWNYVLVSPGLNGDDYQKYRAQIDQYNRIKERQQQTDNAGNDGPAPENGSNATQPQNAGGGAGFAGAVLRGMLTQSGNNQYHSGGGGFFSNSFNNISEESKKKGKTKPVTKHLKKESLQRPEGQVAKKTVVPKPQGKLNQKMEAAKAQRRAGTTQTSTGSGLSGIFGKGASKTGNSTSAFGFKKPEKTGVVKPSKQKKAAIATKKSKASTSKTGFGMGSKSTSTTKKSGLGMGSKSTSTTKKSAFGSSSKSSSTTKKSGFGSGMKSGKKK